MVVLGVFLLSKIRGNCIDLESFSVEKKRVKKRKTKFIEEGANYEVR